MNTEESPNFQLLDFGIHVIADDPDSVIRWRSLNQLFSGVLVEAGCNFRVLTTLLLRMNGPGHHDSAGAGIFLAVGGILYFRLQIVIVAMQNPLLKAVVPSEMHLHNFLTMYIAHCI